MKVLFLSHVFAPAIGGIEASSELLAGAFARRGHEVRVLTTTPGADADWPFRVTRNPSVADMLKHHAWADVVYENNPCLRLGWPKLLFGKPSVVALHTWISRTDGSVGAVDRLKLRWLARANRVIAVSTALQQRCWPAATVIGNAYDDQLFGQRPEARKKDFVFLGRLVSDKGVELAIRAFHDLACAHPVPGLLADAALTVVGAGPDQALLERLAAALPGLAAGRVRFVGALRGEALVAELNRHTFQFIPSAWEEPFGIVALEGIACGLIPIASDGGGLPDAIGPAGVTFKRGQLASLIAATAALLRDPVRQAQCRAAAPAHLARFRAGVITQAFIDALEAVKT